MRKLILPSLIIIFLSIGYYFFKTNSQTSAQAIDEGSTLAHAESSQTSSEIKSSSDVTNSQIKSDDSTTTVSNTPTLEAPEKEKLQKWILEESKNLNQPRVDTKQKDLELKKIIENYSDSEKKYILESALDTSKTANERILSSYLLVLDQSQQSIENLGGLAQKKVPDFGPINPHSEAEIRHSQELAVRYMALDELSRRAQNDPQALEAIKKLASSAESSEIRNYAQRILKEKK